MVKSVDFIKQWGLPIKESANHIKEYCGIADCYGIESFTEYPAKNAAVLEIRAASNRHRHAVVYVVRLNDVNAEYIRGYIEDDKFARALDKLKDCAINGEILLSGGGNTKKSWDMIPNPKLDPYG